jgi:hypothetical protein
MTAPTLAIARRITPANSLRAKVPPFGGPSLQEMRANVDAALETLRGEARDWLRESVDRLTAALEEAAAGDAAAPVERISRIVHDLRAIAIQFDYPLLAEVAQSLCDFIVDAPALAKARLDVIHVHVDAITVILADDLRGPGTAEAASVIDGLAKAVSKARAAAVASTD